MYSIFFHFIQKIMLLLTAFWLWTTIHHLFVLSPWLGLGLLLVLGLAWYKKEHLEPGLKKLFAYKKTLLVLAILFQVAIILSANLLVRRDAAVVLNGALELIEPSSISNYLTRNPNNLFLFLYERFFYKLFGLNAIWVLQVLGLIYINSTAWILYKTGKLFSQRVADLVYLFYLLLMGVSPYVIQTYTDIAGLPFLALQLYLILVAIKAEQASSRSMLILGLVTALAMSFRLTGIISIIAFFMLLFLSKEWKKMAKCLLIFGLSFGISYGLQTYLQSAQTEVVIVKNEKLSKSWLTFINLGLTYSGTDQEDMKRGLLQYIPESEHDNYNNGMFANENELKEIKRRLKGYTLVTFSEHLLYKFSRTVYDGTLNWIYLDPDKEKSAFISPLYQYTKDNAVAEWLRQTIIQKDGKNFDLYRLVKQPIWVVVSLGLFLASWSYRKDRRVNVLLLSVFGGILFLMIFEGGKARYLLQFLPQILLLASLGWAGVKKEN
ncbi:glycosyltransferase family 39 protein [Streptococcus plurextorum]